MELAQAEAEKIVAEKMASLVDNFKAKSTHEMLADLMERLKSEKTINELWKDVSKDEQS